MLAGDINRLMRFRRRLPPTVYNTTHTETPFRRLWQMGQQRVAFIVLLWASRRNITQVGVEKYSVTISARTHHVNSSKQPMADWPLTRGVGLGLHFLARQ